MRIIIAALCLGLGAGTAFAQSPATGAAPSNPHSDGTTVAPQTKGQLQPQGRTGPLETVGPSAPAESPQGQTPPGMHAAPEGSSKTIVDPQR